MRYGHQQKFTREDVAAVGKEQLEFRVRIGLSKYVLLKRGVDLRATSDTIPVRWLEDGTCRATVDLP